MPLIIAAVVRLVFAAAALVAVAYQLFAIHIPRGYDVGSFFAYFTNQSNLLISAVFIVSAVRILRGRTTATPVESAVRGASVVYIAFVGLVFNTLLRDVDLSAISPWVNIVLHYVLPVVGVVDWILWPPRNRLPWSAIGWWMIYPAVYAIAAIVRGALDGFYPYPFFNPAASGGYGGVALLCALMIVGFLVLSLVIRAIGNARVRGRSGTEATDAAPRRR
ncbi:Pr6Pr family membrane protein [Microbacterium sp. CJ88]|uniref:Pr6Pr family membrane protein n=1 Tax=Microbacterium sp. CJ88 TaxID=3445672 RepID=UPI003F65AED0